jgi:hypothetical protein
MPSSRPAQRHRAAPTGWLRRVRRTRRRVLGHSARATSTVVPPAGSAHDGRRPAPHGVSSFADAPGDCSVSTHGGASPSGPSPFRPRCPPGTPSGQPGTGRGGPRWQLPTAALRAQGGRCSESACQCRGPTPGSLSGPLPLLPAQAAGPPLTAADRGARRALRGVGLPDLPGQCGGPPGAAARALSESPAATDTGTTGRCCSCAVRRPGGHGRSGKRKPEPAEAASPGRHAPGPFPEGGGAARGGHGLPPTWLPADGQLLCVREVCVLGARPKPQDGRVLRLGCQGQFAQWRRADPAARVAVGLGPLAPSCQVAAVRQAGRANSGATRKTRNSSGCG